MKFRTYGRDKHFAFPCSKVDVKSAFGEGLLEIAHFGLNTAFIIEPRYIPQPKMHGVVILALDASTGRDHRTSLVVYRIPKTALNESLREAVVAFMVGEMRPWLEAKVARRETEVFGADHLLVELWRSRLRLHETRWPYP